MTTTLEDVSRYFTRIALDIMPTLDSYITDDEIKKTLFSIPHKAFGLDGYTSLFFKRSWDIISKDFIATMRYFFDSSTLPRCVNATRISLISKIETLMIMNNFRRISCSNVIYKYISKVIVSGLKGMLVDVIGPS